MSEVAEEVGAEVAEPSTEETEAPEAPEVPDEEEPEEPEAVASPEAQGAELVLGMNERDLEEMQKKLERSATTWRNRVSELLGETAQILVPCELCDPSIPGFHWPSDVEQPRSDEHARLLDVLRTPAAPDFQPARHVRQCADCDGWGAVLSGSRVAGKERVTCPTCKGQGFQGDAIGAPVQQVTNGEVAVEFPAESQPLVSDDADVWGSPKLLDDGQENPNYGKMPQYKNPLLP